ncbi:hypothetical protein K431DRAFT_310435 [Polychaeton citri CBS 116435]|uniref:Zn(2)-C6 fungal-type domain-containing protein n=1 Tax=Polychaeton citri CBS 116435 TaxID=1314669 RepID=A0A9P4QED2_9PEZI|nr:hypothetical protein K431DRAFT_310435 [Polychaeton citri CBS 116435]
MGWTGGDSNWSPFNGADNEAENSIVMGDLLTSYSIDHPIPPQNPTTTANAAAATDRTEYLGPRVSDSGSVSATVVGTHRIQEPHETVPKVVRNERNFVDHGVAFFLPPDENRCADQRENATHRAYIDGIEVDLTAVSKYDLRLAPREHRDGYENTWIDQDETGDYDPKSELQQARVQQQQQRLRLRRQRCTKRENTILQHDTRITVEPKRLIASLRFANPETKRRLVNFVAYGNDADSGYRFRERQDRSAYMRGDQECDSSLIRSAVPLARGCRHCALLGLTCSIIDDEFEYPCKACSEDAEVCELIRPPARKRGCEVCKRKKRSCSYKRTYKHGSNCRECARDADVCIAGPAKDAVAVRLRCPLEGVALRDHASWLQKRLTAKKPKIIKFCSNCEKTDLDYPTPQSGRNGKSGLACCDDGDDFPFQNGAPNQYMAPQHNSCNILSQCVPPPGDDGVKGLVTASGASGGSEFTITTRFFHPIRFNHDTTPDPAQSCHFCQEPALAVFGSVPRKIRVTLTADGTSYQELNDEDNGPGVENTKICSLCTYRRMQVAICVMHDLRPMPSARRKDEHGSLDAALNRLEGGSSSGAEEWCSICPSLATHSCTSPQDVADGEESPEHGCGLRACDTCVNALSMEYGGDLQHMLAEVRDEPSEERPWGLRADAELFREDGLLVRYAVLSDA